jgi:ATP-dependent 26S proteasome regulatory subunit
VATPTPVIEKPQEKPTEKMFTQAQLDDMIKERLKREKMEKADRLEAEKADLQKELEATKQEATLLKRQNALAGKVVDVDAATKLLSDEFVVNGEVQLEPFLAKYPFLKAQATPPVNPTPGGRGAMPANALTREQVSKMTPDEINKRWAEVQAVMKG